jgi:transposase InsO family protein
MIVTLQTHQLNSIEQVREFILGTDPVVFGFSDRKQAHLWMADTLRRFAYGSRSKAHKGLLKRYLSKVSGLSMAQVERYIRQFLEDGTCEDRRKLSDNLFRTRYTEEDVRLLAELDTIHENLSGPATKKLCERMYQVFGDHRYERLSTISNGHLYNLRKEAAYAEVRQVFQKTRSTKIQIGVRRKPYPNGTPGYLRVDSVHQGDLDGIKGVYLINAVDEVTQMQCIVAVERISEVFMIPALNQMIESFPFVIKNFHSDCGSEYINRKVSEMLEKLRIDQTKSRARQCNDNALVESKNASTVRKYLGYAHIPAPLADLVSEFTRGVLTPYINYHRPCFFAHEEEDAKGKIRKKYRYEDMMTPYEKFRSLPQNESYLRTEVTVAQLDAIASAQSDNEAGLALQKARQKLFQTINKRSQRSAA